MMFNILLILSIVSLAFGQPIDTKNAVQSSPPSDEVVYVPYSFKFMPVEYPIHQEKSPEKEALIPNRENVNKVLALDDVLLNEDIKIPPIAALEDTLNKIPKPIIDNEDLKKQSSKAKESTIDHFEEADLSKSSEDYVLVPISVLKKLEEDAISGSHIVRKRQTSDRRLSRRPALVGYLNDYDLFPTVA